MDEIKHVKYVGMAEKVAVELRAIESFFSCAEIDQRASVGLIPYDEAEMEAKRFATKRLMAFLEDYIRYDRRYDIYKNRHSIEARIDLPYLYDEVVKKLNSRLRFLENDRMKMGAKLAQALWLIEEYQLPWYVKLKRRLKRWKFW